MPLDSRALWEKLVRLRGTAGMGDHWLWCLDFDGTLVDIASRPDAIMVPPTMVADLHRLAARPEQTVAIISGRTLADLRRYLGDEPNLWLSGDHGGQIMGPNFHWNYPITARHRHRLETLCRQWIEAATSLPGVMVEPKPYSFSIHYRLAAESVKQALYSIIRQTRWPTDMVLKESHQCFEVHLSLGPTKGRAVVEIMRHLGVARSRLITVAFGDDQTDEDMFLALQTGITVRVSPAPVDTAAQYQVPNPDAVRELIHWMAAD